MTWSEVLDNAAAETHLVDLVVLAQRVLAADGGLPLAAEDSFLRRRHLGGDVLTLAARGPAGRLLAAGAVRPGGAGAATADAGATVTGLVDPGARGRGLGAELLDRILAEAAGRGGPVTVECESVTPAVEDLFAGRGLHRFFAEDVLRFDLASQQLPPVQWPTGAALLAWSPASAARFFAVYDAAFRDRPGFPGWSAPQWIADTADDEDFRPDWSVLVSFPGSGDVGFVTAALGWIVQVGVVPAARGAGLGAALVGEALRRMRAGGERRALLDVNVNNPAARLYRRLGFVDQGRRARYRR